MPAFLELAPVTNRGFATAPVDGCECTLEFENSGGAKMRVHLKGTQTPDLAALNCTKAAAGIILWGANRGSNSVVEC